jgi:hypothetical protein
VQVTSVTPQTDESTATAPHTKAQGAGDLNVVAIGFNQPQEERDGLAT